MKFSDASFPRGVAVAAMAAVAGFILLTVPIMFMAGDEDEWDLKYAAKACQHEIEVAFGSTGSRRFTPHPTPQIFPVFERRYRLAEVKAGIAYDNEDGERRSFWYKCTARYFEDSGRWATVEVERSTWRGR